LVCTLKITIFWQKDCHFFVKFQKIIKPLERYPLIQAVPKNLRDENCKNLLGLLFYQEKQAGEESL
jgi:hypothetical protein